MALRSPPNSRLAIAASIGEEGQSAPSSLSAASTEAARYSIELPGLPRWCVTDAACERVFLAIREPSMILVARLPELDHLEHWKVSSGGAHGLEIDHQRGRLYAACDDKALTEIDIGSGKVSNEWPLAGAPDVTFLNPNDRPCPCRDRQAGTGAVDRSSHRRECSELMTGRARPYDRNRAAGSALRVLTGTWRGDGFRRRIAELRRCAITIAFRSSMKQ